MNLRYLKDVVTLELDSDKCTGCGLCTHVCGHAVFVLNGGVIEILDRDGCRWAVPGPYSTIGLRKPESVSIRQRAVMNK
jgi:ferredoxin